MSIIASPDARKILRRHFTSVKPENFKREYRTLARALHPDTGGSHDLMAVLNDVYEDARNGKLRTAEPAFQTFTYRPYEPPRYEPPRYTPPAHEMHWQVSGWTTPTATGKFHADRSCFALRRAKNVVRHQTLRTVSAYAAYSWACGHCGARTEPAGDAS